MPILFLVLLILPTPTHAQTPGQPSVTVDFKEFLCLFEKKTTNGDCAPNPSPADIKTGAASGVVYGKVEKFSATGISSFIMQLGLFTDVAKEKGESKYFYSRVADDRLETFLLRIKYIPSGSTTPVYKLFNIPYQKKDVDFSVSSGIRTINITTGAGASSQVALGFYRLNPVGNGDEVIKQQVALTEVKTVAGNELPYGAAISADFWYCGGEKEGTRTIPGSGIRNPIDGRDAPRDGTRVEYFTADGSYKDINGRHTDGIAYGETKCGGTAYYKIGTTTDFTLPATQAAAQTESEQQLDSGITSSEYIGSVLPLCSIDPFTDGSVMGCVAQIVYGGIFRPVAFFAQLMGKIFDFFLGYSLSDESYRHDFIQTGWQLVRDISNIFFIVIMIWSGLMAVFNTSGAPYKKVIPTLIINALIINFSLFATRVVIDVSNITARIFYNQMVVKVDGEVKPGSTGYKPISEAIVSSFNPQKIFENSVLESETAEKGSEKNKENENPSFNGQDDASKSTGGFHRYSKEYAGYFTLVTLVAIAITFSVAMMFWKTGFMFIGRVVGLYIAMIFSPFAFLSRGGVPLVSKIPSLNYGSWWNDLSQYALLAPIFVFFLYIINAFLNVQFFTKIGLDQNGQGFFGSVMYVMIPMLIIYGLVSRGVSIAKSLAGEYGNMAQNFANKATGFVGGAALGIASGGLAFAGTRGAGLLRLSEEKRAELAEERSRGGLAGRLASLRLGLNDRAQAGSFDFRKSKAFGGVTSLLGEAGVKLNDKVSSTIGLGSDATKGGMKAIEKKEKEALKKKIESIKTDFKDDTKAKEFWERRSTPLVEKEKQRLLNDTAALEAAYLKAGKKQTEIDAMKASGTLKDGVDVLAKKEVDAKFGVVSNNKQLTQAMRLQFADTIASGKTFGQQASATLASLALVGSAGVPLPGTLPITGAAVYDGKRKGDLEKEEAGSYGTKTRKTFGNKNKLPKEDRLEIEKKSIETELESIDKTLKDIFEAEIASNSIHANKTAEDFFNDPKLAQETIRKARKTMRDEMELLDLDIDLLKTQYHDAMKAGRTTNAADLKRKMEDTVIEKREKGEKYEQTNPDTKLKKQADLNKKDEELEKMKEKREAAEKSKDEKKDK